MWGENPLAYTIRSPPSVMRNLNFLALFHNFFHLFSQVVNASGRLEGQSSTSGSDWLFMNVGGVDRRRTRWG